MSKCKYCTEPATKRVIWADGRAMIQVCDKHLSTAKKTIADQDDEVVAVENITEEKEPDAKSWPEFNAFVNDGGLDAELKLITPGGRVGSDRRTGSRANGENWVERTPKGELPQYIRIVRNGLMREGHSESRATALAVAAIKRWARGGDNVSPKVQAAAAKALAEWEAMKGSKSAVPSPIQVRARIMQIKAKKKKTEDDSEYTARQNLVRGENQIERDSGKKDPNRVSGRGTDPSKGKDSEEGGKGKARRIATAAGEQRYKGKIGDLIGGTGDKDTTADRDARIEEAANLEAKLKDMVPLKKGAKGVEVRYLQDMLEKGGYGKFVLDGVYGPKTEAAVRKAQKDLGLKETGQVDAELLNKLTKEHSLKGEKPSGGSDSATDSDGSGQSVSDELGNAPKPSKARIARARKEAEKDPENVLSTEDPKDMAKLRGWLSEAGYDVEDDWEVDSLEMQEILKSLQEAAGLPQDGTPDALLVQLIRDALGGQKSFDSFYDSLNTDDTETKDLPMQIEYKAVTVNGLKVLDDEEGLIDAYVSVTGIEDNVADIIDPGAYEKTLMDRIPKGVWHHDWATPISKTVQVKELMPGDAELPKSLPNGQPWPKSAGALKVRTKFNLKTTRGRDAYEDVKFFDDQQEWSIGFNVPVGGAITEKVNGKSIRRIQKIDLFEYSPVLFGAMPSARTKSVKEAQFAFKSLMGTDLESFTSRLIEVKAAAGQLEAMGVAQGKEDEEPEKKNEKEGYGKCKKCGGPLDPDGVCPECGPEDDGAGEAEDEKSLFPEITGNEIEHKLSAVSVNTLRKAINAMQKVLDEAMGADSSDAPQDEDDVDKKVEKELPAPESVKTFEEAMTLTANSLPIAFKSDLVDASVDFDEALDTKDAEGIESSAEMALDAIEGALDTELDPAEEKAVKWLLEVVGGLVKSASVDDATVDVDETGDVTSGDKAATGETEQKSADKPSSVVIDMSKLDSFRSLLN